MSARVPRHRGEKTPATRRREAQVMLLLLGLAVMVVAWVWFVVATDNVLLAIGLLLGSFLGGRLREKRKARRRQCAAETQRGSADASAR